MSRWTRNIQGLLNLFLESRCPLCDRSTNTEFCLDCTRQLQRCQLTHPQQSEQQPLPIFVWGSYQGTLKRAISSLKYENQPQIAHPLGIWLAKSWLTSPLATSQVIVVPIPLHANRQKQRGYNQAALIAESFCSCTGLKLQKSGLMRQKATEAQFNLSPQQREQNLNGAFELGIDFCYHRPKMPVLLVDDIYTTGATARVAAQTLQKQGIAVCGMVAIATSQGHN
ncbi:ComF family protein [Synechocystis sp. PCC 7509]|uniref:ComF family protein n=1 Tax=Synechocystis sp. PCC 7509 TaxID=927677 RepID=UPI0002AC25AC|nr:ComF family protein [Synechocystis sp. PCC 7509]